MVRRWIDGEWLFWGRFEAAGLEVIDGYISLGSFGFYWVSWFCGSVRLSFGLSGVIKALNKSGEGGEEGFVW